ncbi:MAG: hypothetical protein ACRDHY_15985 [Anaerolineales bacterium]
MKPVLISILLLAAVLPAAPAYACSCAPAPGALEAIAQASAAFTGRVIEVDSPAGYEPLIVRFEVETVWKGPVQAEIEIRTARDSAGCGFAFQENVSYLVYAYEEDGALFTTLCSRSAPLEGAGGDLGALGQGAAPAQAEDQIGWPLVAAGAVLVIAGAALMLRWRRAGG